MEANPQIAVVIPSFKSEYLAATLNSLSNQTDKRFGVYVGDDASPGPIQEICSQFADKLDLRYHRFPDNLGGSSLIDQWHRCIELSSEPWIWLFSDDDTADPGCIETFYAALEQTQAKFDLYRFNTLNINEQNQVVAINPPHPKVESGLEFAYHRLCKNRSSYVSEYIFSRDVFNKHGGMVKFPLAWCSDDASWITFAGEPGIFTIDGPKVGWRKSQVNLSFASPKHRREKIEACALFLDWLTQKHPAEAIEKQLALSSEIFQECARTWFLSQIRNQAPLGPRLWLEISKKQLFNRLGRPLNRFINMILIDLLCITTSTIDLIRKRA